jgi:GntR family transcriptional regulator
MDGRHGGKGAVPLLDAEPALAPLDRTSFLPYYRQIVEQITNLIKLRRLTPGQTFWPEGVIAQKLGVSKMTVRQAFQVLRTDGLLVVAKGKPPVVGSGRVLKDFRELRGFTEEMQLRGLIPSSRLLEIDVVLADFEVAGALKLAQGDSVFRIKRLRLASGEPVGIETTHLPARLFPSLEEHDLEKDSLYRIIETNYVVQLDSSEEQLQAVSAEAEDARLLRIRRGFPLFLMRRRVYSADGTAIEYGISRFRGDRYTATVVSHRRR